MLQSIRCIRLNLSPRIILPIYLLVQRAQTRRGKFISSNSFYRNHSYQKVIKENTFGSITLELGSNERWILVGERLLYLMHEKLEFDFHSMGRYDIQP